MGNFYKIKRLLQRKKAVSYKEQFSKYILRQTLENGSDIGEAMVELFEVLNTPVRRRGEVGAALMQFPYVNGGLFA